MSPALRRAAWFGLVLAVLLVFTVTGGYVWLGAPLSRLGNEALAILVLGSWLAVAVARPAWRPRTPLLPAVLLVCLAYSLSTLTSQRPRLSLEPFLGGLALALLFVFLTTLLADRWFRKRAEGLIVAGTAIIGLAYLASVALEWVDFYRLTGAAVLPPLRPSWVSLNLGSPNIVATVLLLLAPLAVAILARATRRTWPAVLLGGLATVDVFVTGSRGGYLGAGLGIVVLVMLVLARPDIRARVRPGLSWARRRPIILVLVAVVLVGCITVAPLIAFRFAQGGDALRLDLWRSAVAIFLEHPVLGGGPGTWVQLKVESAPPGSSNLIVPHAHDLYVQAAAELGIVGLLALATLAAAVVARLYRAIRFGPPDAHPIPVAVGLVAFLGQSLVDNLVNLPLICLLVAGVTAWVDAGVLVAAPTPVRRVTLEDAWSDPAAAINARAGGPAPWRERLGLGVVVAGLVAMVVAIPTLDRINRAANAQLLGDAAVTGDPEAALAAYNDALALDPDLTLYALGRAATLARLGRLSDAREELSAAVTLDPVGINLMSLASLDLAVGDRTAALSHVRAAVARAPKDLTIALNAGRLAAQLGDRTLALEQLASAVASRPAIASLPLFDDAPGIVSKAEVVAAARASTVDRTVAALISAYAGDTAGATAELDSLPASGERDLSLAVVRWLAGDTATAIEALQQRVARNPLDYVAAGRLAAMLESVGDARAGHYARLARLVEGDAWPAVADELTARIAPPSATGLGLPADYPWAVYVRAFRGTLAAPGLTLIESGFEDAAPGS